jgi:hypothetical protein
MASPNLHICCQCFTSSPTTPALSHQLLSNKPASCTTRHPSPPVTSSHISSHVPRPAEPTPSF